MGGIAAAGLATSRQSAKWVCRRGPMELTAAATNPQRYATGDETHPPAIYVWVYDTKHIAAESMAHDVLRLRIA